LRRLELGVDTIELDEDVRWPEVERAAREESLARFSLEDKDREAVRWMKTDELMPWNWKLPPIAEPQA